MTIPDLIWLSVGVAVAASLGWSHLDVAARTPVGTLLPGWFLSVDFAVETIMKGCLALVPVVIARRVRHGGPIQAVEFALLNEGLSHLLVRIEQSPWLGLVWTSLTAPGSLLVDVDRFPIWQAGSLAVAPLALLAAVVRRHRPPAWVAGVLLVVAYHGLSTAGIAYLQRRENDHFPFDWFGRGTARILYLLFGQGPFQVVWFLPLGAALVEATRRKGERWTWVDWSAFGLPSPLAVTAYVRSFIKIYHGPRAASSDGQYAYVAMLLGSLALAVLLVRAPAPAWGRFFAVADSGGPGDAGSPGSVSG